MQNSIILKRNSLTHLVVVVSIIWIYGCSNSVKNENDIAVPSYLEDYAELYKESPRKANLEWFKDAKYGLFIHYGLYSILEDGEWIQLRHDPPITVADYDTLVSGFQSG